MFTGLVERMGHVREVHARGNARRVTIATAGLSDESTLLLGESVAVDGCCLTVDRIVQDGFEADASEETLRRTTLGALRAGAKVNLERAMRPQDRLGGHLVTGHVDALGHVRALESIDGAQKVVISLPAELARYVAEKGSITVAGVSLTVNGVSPSGSASAWFHVALIPHTQARTTLHELTVGQAVNLEVDLVARYVARLLGADAGAAVGGSADLATLLKTHGFGTPQ